MPYRASRCIPMKKVALLHHTGAGFEADMAEWGRWRSAMGSEVERVNELQQPSKADREQQRKLNCETRRGEHRGEETKEEERGQAPLPTWRASRQCQQRAFRPALTCSRNLARSCSSQNSFTWLQNHPPLARKQDPRSLSPSNSGQRFLSSSSSSPFSALTLSICDYAPTAVAWSSYSATSTRTASKFLASTTRRPSPPPLPARRHLQLLLLRYRANRPTFAT